MAACGVHHVFQRRVVPTYMVIRGGPVRQGVGADFPTVIDTLLIIMINYSGACRWSGGGPQGGGLLELRHLPARVPALAVL
jgi:hypothetical protein